MNSHEAKAITQAMIRRENRLDFWDHLTTVFANTNLDSTEDLLKQNISSFKPDAFYYAVKVHDIQYLQTRSHFSFLASSFLPTGLGYGTVTHFNLFPGATICYTKNVRYLVGFNRDVNSHQLILKSVDIELEAQQGWPTLTVRGVSDGKAKARDLDNLRQKMAARWRQKLLAHKAIKKGIRPNTDYTFYSRHSCLPYAEALIKPSHLHTTNPVVDQNEFSHLLITAAVRGGLSIGNMCYTVAMQIEFMSKGVFLPILFYDHTQGSYTPISNDILAIMYFVFKIGKLQLLTDAKLDHYFFDLVDSSNIPLTQLVKNNYQLNLKEICDALSINKTHYGNLCDDLKQPILTYLQVKNYRAIQKLVKSHSDFLADSSCDSIKESMVLSCLIDNQPVLLRKVLSLNFDLSSIFTKLEAQKNIHLLLKLMSTGKGKIENSIFRTYLNRILVLAINNGETATALDCITLGASASKAMLLLAMSQRNTQVVQRILAVTRFSNTVLIDVMKETHKLDRNTLEPLFEAALNRNFIHALQNYKRNRIFEKKIQGRSHHHILGGLIEHDAETKVQAAGKLRAMLKRGLPEGEFTHAEIAALQNGRLRNIIDQQINNPGSELMVEEIQEAKLQGHTPWKWFLCGLLITASLASLVMCLIGISVVTAILGMVGTLLAGAAITTLGGVIGSVSEVCTRKNTVIERYSIAPPLAVLAKPVHKPVMQSGPISANQSNFQVSKLRS